MKLYLSPNEKKTAQEVSDALGNDLPRDFSSICD
jgi:type IV secretory pathway TraG/TraD family ATPase VirD4